MPIYLQLSYIFERLVDKQCVLPAANHNTPGISTGRGGEALVVGIVFADSQAAGIDVHRHTVHTTTLLGGIEAAIPTLAVDITGEEEGFGM